eukprot:gb/GECG01010012.1/.p1 GENE.gb/GECG01010012.1/~~gb/GECG01010012.1/.p1  ORF type:complete len:186 (+),score=31.92 gb/GECG01010012.1/:1-558(+)
MGQYYIVVNLAKQQFLKPPSLKLMEHSFLENQGVKCFFNLIADDWKFDKCVWLGDYAPNPEMSYSDVHEQFEEIPLETAKPIDRLERLYFVCEEAKQFISMDKYIEAHQEKKHPNGYIISPTLLLADGNGLGNGDYQSSQGGEYIGNWAYKDIALLEKPPKDYTEILPRFNSPNEFHDEVEDERE